MHRTTFYACAFIASVSCSENKATTPAVDAGPPDAGPSQPVLGGKLGAAVAAAKQQDAKSNQEGSLKPPETGVFAAEEANKALKAGEPTKVELITEGSDPKTTLALKLSDTSEESSEITIQVQTGMQTALPALTLKTSTGKNKDNAEFTTKVTGVTTDPEQMATLPPEAAGLLNKLKGSTVTYSLKESGIIQNARYELAKGTDPQLEPVIASLKEAILLISTPLPSKPVGKGATWMTTDRSIYAGISLIRYRVFKIESMDNGQISLSIDCREYAADAAAELSNGNQKVPVIVGRFESQGKATLSWSANRLIPATGEMGQKSQALLLVQAQGGQRKLPQMTGIEVKLNTSTKK